MLTGADIGQSVRVAVTATNVAGDATATSSPTAAVVADPPANTVVPTLTGTADRGQRRSRSTTGTWTGTAPDRLTTSCGSAATLAGDNCVAIAGATGTTYTLTADDLDATIRALVTATNAGGVAAVATVPSAIVAIDPPANTVAPVVTGDRVDGETLTTDDGTLDRHAAAALHLPVGALRRARRQLRRPSPARPTRPTR